MSTDSEAVSPAPVVVPNGDPPKPKPEDFEPPVAWLFGREFIASLKYVLLYTAFKGKLDARDWMNPNIIPADPPGDSHAGTPTDPPRGSRATPEELWQQWGEAARDAAEGEFWFDYISDTGDGQKAVYSIAYLCMSDLAAGGEPQPGDELEFASSPDPAALKAEGKRLLPRGTFLLVGGDTSYHISDYATIAERFWKPFRWAYRDLFNEGAASVTGGKSRLLLGIPGNHDYYDSLDGFNRQFRRPSTGDAAPPADGRPPQLPIPTFERAQEGSYLALRLPFDWWLWGMDTEAGEIDFRQWEFFKDINERHAPAKLIVATPEPTTVFGKHTSADANQSKTFAALGLELPFLKDGEPMRAGRCRLDLSGDIHHYARHWGAPRGSDDSSNYASVVAGGGGAFFHPTHTTIDEARPEVIYPPAEQSRVKVANELFKFWNIVRGGFVWLFGALIALVVFFAASFPSSTRDAVDTFPYFIEAGISTGLAQPPGDQIGGIPRKPFWAEGESLPVGDDYVSGAVLMGLSLVLLGIALAYSAKLFEKEYDPPFWRPKNAVTTAQRVFLWALIFASFASLAFGIRGLWQSVGLLTRLGHSLIILLGLVWSVMAVVQSVWYSEWLFDAASRDSEEARRQWPLWVLMILAVLGFGSTVWFFGRHESGYLVSDIVVLIVVALAVGGLTYFAVSTGGGLKRGAGKVAFGLLGLSHGLLQLIVPFLLVRKGHLLWASLAMAAVVVVFKYLGRWLAKKKSGWPLAAAWVLLGAALVAVPFVLNTDLKPHLFGGGMINSPTDGWWRLGLCLLAAAAGAILSCVLFGWYLAVALAFNGHNNEAGGAARFEGFKQFVRFRLTRERLTGYVVAFDAPSTDGRSLRPKIVDVFHVSDRPASAAAAAAPGARSEGQR